MTERDKQSIVTYNTALNRKDHMISYHVSAGPNLECIYEFFPSADSVLTHLPFRSQVQTYQLGVTLAKRHLQQLVVEVEEM